MLRASRARPALAACCLLAWAPGAAATPPLAEFVKAARERALENQEQRARAESARARRRQARDTLLPSLFAEGSYTRNHPEVSVTFQEEGEETTVLFVRKNQLNAEVSISGSILDVSALYELRVAKKLARAAELDAAATEREVTLDVARAYYEYVGYSSLVGAAQRSRDAAAENLDVVETRAEAGLASELERERAAAELASRRQDVAEAELAARDAARTLVALSGIEPDRQVPPLPGDLSPEPPLDELLDGAATRPEVRAALARASAGEARAEAEWWNYAPELGAEASYSYTNAGGFGPPSAWAAGLTLTWEVGLDTAEAARAEEAAARADRLRARRLLRDARDEIARLRDQTDSLRVRARAASAQARAAGEAARQARAAFEAGRASQLEVVQAQRDAFSARVDEIRALADLAYARVALRVASGRTEEIAP